MTRRQLIIIGAAAVLCAALWELNPAVGMAAVLPVTFYVDWLLWRE